MSFAQVTFARLSSVNEVALKSTHQGTHHRHQKLHVLPIWGQLKGFLLISIFLLIQVYSIAFFSALKMETFVF